MKLMIVSHACVTPINQNFYAQVSELTGWDVSLVIPAVWSTEYKANVEPTRWEGFAGPIHMIPVWKPGNIPLHVYKNTMVGVLRKEAPNAIYVHHEPYGLATFQIYMANRLVGNCPTGFYAAQNIVKQYPPPFRWFEHYVFSQSSFAFPVAHGALDVLRQKGYRGEAEVLPLPLDPGIYQRRPEWAASKRSELGLGTDEFVIGYLGRLVEEKGLCSLLGAAAILKDRRWTCVLVGSGPLESRLRALAAELGIADRLIFAGYVPHEEAPGWFSLFDLFVLPSETRPNWKEQFGRVIVEANACRTAVLGTQSGEIGNVLRTTGGGVTVPEANKDALAEAILFLMENPSQRRKLAETGEQSALREYGQLHLTRRFAATIESAMSRTAKKEKS